MAVSTAATESMVHSNEVSATEPPNNGRRRGTTVTSIAQSVQSAADILGEVLNKDPPPGFFAAAADTASHAPTVGEIRRGSFGHRGWHIDGQRHDRRHRATSPANERSHRHRSAHKSGERRQSYVQSGGATETIAAVHEEPHPTPEAKESFPEFDRSDADCKGAVHDSSLPQVEAVETRATEGSVDQINKPLAIKGRVYSSGYVPPPVVPWKTTMAVGSKAFLKWVITPFGFFWTVYGLNVVAWGGMLFLLLVNASPAMCWAPIPEAAPDGQPGPVASLRAIHDAPRYRNCNDIFSPRRIWLEIDSQILNALFCVTGFGLAPWRFRDLWFLLSYRLRSEKKSGIERKMYGLRRLAGFYRAWFRLPGSNTLDVMSLDEYEEQTTNKSQTLASVHPAVIENGTGWTSSEVRLPLPIPPSELYPATGIRAPPTAAWKMDLFVWCQIGNTAFQIVLCGFMWGMTRYNRPSWATGLFIALACIIAGVGGIVSYVEGRKVKRVEGVLVVQ